MTKNSRDIICVSHSSFLAGAEMAFYEMIVSLNNAGFNIIAVFPERGKLPEICKPYLQELYYIKSPWWFSEKKSRIRKIKLVLKIILSSLYFVKLFYKLKRKVIVVNTSVIPAPAVAARILRKKTLWFVHEIGDDGFKYVFGEKFTKNIIPRVADKVVFNSFFVCNHYKSITKANNTEVIYQPILVNSKKETDFLEDGIIKYGVLGRISEQKNQMEAVIAFSKLVLPNKKLYLIGHDKNSYADEIKKFVTLNGLQDNVIFTGNVPDVGEILCSLDVIIACGYNEALGRTLIEGMKLSKPVIAPNAFGYKELIIDQFNGLFYEHNNIEDLVDKMRRIIDQDEYLKLSVNALNWSHDNFSSEVFSRRFMQLIEV